MKVIMKVITRIVHIYAIFSSRVSINFGNPLILAIVQDDLEKVYLALAQGIPVNQEFVFKHPPLRKFISLMLAVSRHNKEIVTALLQAGADYNYCIDGYSMMSLRYLDAYQLKAGQAEIIIWPHWHDGPTLYRNNNNALAVAVYNQSKEAVQALINAKVPLNNQDSMGSTALILASTLSHYEIVRMLLEAGADILLQDAHGHTAFSRAQQNYRTSFLPLEKRKAQKIGKLILEAALMQKKFQGIFSALKTHFIKQGLPQDIIDYIFSCIPVPNTHQNALQALESKVNKSCSII